MAIIHTIVHISVWLVTNYVGVISNYQLCHTDTTILLSSFEKTTTLTNDHIACTRYFNQIMNIIIKTLMKWDKKLQCFTLGGGLFGFCKRFFASTKS
jgi:hypothetical protein